MFNDKFVTFDFLKEHCQGLICILTPSTPFVLFNIFLTINFVAIYFQVNVNGISESSNLQSLKSTKIFFIETLNFFKKNKKNTKGFTQ